MLRRLCPQGRRKTSADKDGGQYIEDLVVGELAIMGEDGVLRIRMSVEESDRSDYHCDLLNTATMRRVARKYELALPDLTEAMRGALESDGFVVLSAGRFERVRQNWRLCREAIRAMDRILGAIRTEQMATNACEMPQN